MTIEKAPKKRFVELRKVAAGQEKVVGAEPLTVAASQETFRTELEKDSVSPKKSVCPLGRSVHFTKSPQPR